MKFRVGDTVLVTGGKDKGKQGKIVRVMPELNKVVVENVNIYVKHIKPMNGQEGRRVEQSRPLPTANIAIVNNEGKADRIGFSIKGATKTRIFKKTGKPVPVVERAQKTVKKSTTV